MLGAIIGDVCGSTYEVREIKKAKNKEKVLYEERIKILDKNTPLFLKDSSMTDDSILTIAIYDALISGGCYEEKLREYGLNEVNLGKDKYGRSRFGSGFVNWLNNKGEGNSYGNGCAMRISSIPEVLDDLDKIKEEVYKATIPTHNHDDAILCAEALACVIYFAKKHKDKKYIREYIEKNYFSLDYNLEDLQRNYTFSSKAILSVPQAIYVFLESDNFEDALRKSISIGGDSDTIACMTSSIAENYYGIPSDIKRKVLEYIPNNYKKLVYKFYDENI